MRWFRFGRGRPRDPVCRREVGPGEAVGTDSRGGTTYYFCSVNCLMKFREFPDLYDEAPAR